MEVFPAEGVLFLQIPVPKDGHGILGAVFDRYTRIVL
jgi:hypothetical protein